jgi:hypothetical protein
MRPHTREISTACAAILLLTGCVGPGLCVHGRNWPYKVGSDPEVERVSLVPVATTIEALVTLPHEERPADLRRFAPVEYTTYVLHDVTLRSFQRAPDGDVHMVLADDQGHTMIAEAAPPFCTPDDSPWKPRIVAVRKVVDDEIPMAMMGSHVRTVSLAGPAYFDTLHGQFGVAPNGIEIHPVLAMCFGRGCSLPDRLDR